MAITSAVIAGVTAVGSGIQQRRAAKANNRAQKKAAAIERTSAQLEHNQRVRRAIAARRIQQAEIIQGSASQGARSSSAVAGAVGSLTTQTASNIGAASTSLAAKIGQSRALQAGATKSTRRNSSAQTLSSISSLSGTAATSQSASDFFVKAFGRP